jgi:hypothetical protein
MKYSIYILSILICTACYHATKKAVQAQQTKQHAKVFSLSIVEAYLSDDCNTVFNAMSDSIFIMDGDGIFPTKGQEDKLCGAVKRAIRDKEKTMADYLETYTIEMLTRTELEERFERKLPDYYKTIASDFFFLGWQLKEGKTKVDDFIWDDMFVFMVRYENGNWTIKGVSG